MGKGGRGRGSKYTNDLSGSWLRRAILMVSVCRWSLDGMEFLRIGFTRGAAMPGFNRMVRKLPGLCLLRFPAVMRMRRLHHQKRSLHPLPDRDHAGERAQTEQVLAGDPYSGHLFLFRATPMALALARAARSAHIDGL